MIAAVESAARTGGLVVLGFHGVGGDYLRVSAEAHAQLLAYLKEHADTIWGGAIVDGDGLRRQPRGQLGRVDTIQADRYIT